MTIEKLEEFLNEGEGYTLEYKESVNSLSGSVFSFGYADSLGSGVRNLYKYTKIYSNAEPDFEEGDVFRLIVPMRSA